MSGYNHRDPDADRKPLTLHVRTLPSRSGFASHDVREVRTTIRTAAGTDIGILLRTDSPHLERFFAENWGSRPAGRVDATILALAGPASRYRMDPDLDGARWYCPHSREVWQFGTEYYGNLKVTVRGLCSELAGEDEMFIHGCALSISGRGVVLTGMSGAGKTTLTAAMRKLRPGEVRIVNDDWGPLSLRQGTLRFTGERHLHMKYPSVAAIAPLLAPQPKSHLSENHAGDSLDPHARLLIRPGEVFGSDGVAESARLALYVVLRRDPQEPPASRPLLLDDLSSIEQGQYSAFYQRYESFQDGSLFLLDESSRARHREKLRRLLTSFQGLLLNNSGTPEDGARAVLTALKST